MNVTFTQTKRKELEQYLHKQLSVAQISQIMGVKKQTIYKEIKNGIDNTLRTGNRISDYDAFKAQQKVEKDWLDMIRK